MRWPEMHYLIGCHAVPLAKGHVAHLTPAVGFVHINELMFLLHVGFLVHVQEHYKVTENRGPEAFSPSASQEVDDCGWWVGEMTRAKHEKIRSHSKCLLVKRDAVAPITKPKIFFPVCKMSDLLLHLSCNIKMLSQVLTQSEKLPTITSHALWLVTFN